MRLREWLVGGCVTVGLSVVLIETEAFESFYDLSRRHEAWELDELVLVAIAASVSALGAMLIAAKRHVRELRDAGMELRRARDQAAIASHAKTRFLASMSHEFRTPLNSVIGFSDVLANNARDPLTPGQREHLEYIRQSGRQLLALVEELLGLAQFDYTTPTLTIERVDIDRLLREVASAAKEQASAADVRFEPAPPSGVVAAANGAALRRVLRNLMVNAILYNRPGGVVRVAARWLEGDFVEIVVSDTGRGIAAARLAELFQPFSRLGLEGSAIPGAGIGLAVSKQLVDAMNGSIEVDSEEDRGSTFTIRLRGAAVD